MKAQLHESQLEMRSSLTCGVFGVGSNLPADQQARGRKKERKGEASVIITKHNQSEVIELKADLKYDALLIKFMFQHKIINV